MRRIAQCVLATLGLGLIASCGGGSNDPVDRYLGAWRSACYAYTGNDGNTYFKRLTNNFTKASPTSLNVSFSDSIAHSDSACNNILGAISNPAGGTVELGAKAEFLGAQVDSINASFPGEELVGYITVKDAQLFIIAELPNVALTGWGAGSPYTMAEGKQAAVNVLTKSAGSAESFAQARPASGYSK